MLTQINANLTQIYADKSLICDHSRARLTDKKIYQSASLTSASLTSVWQVWQVGQAICGNLRLNIQNLFTGV